jgi:hypothetical protein
MPIFEQGYEHWSGKLSGHGLRWWTITRNGLRAQLRSKWTWVVVLAAWVPALGLAAALIAWGLFENKSGLLTPLLPFLERLPPALKKGPSVFAYRSGPSPLTPFWESNYSSR